MNDMKKLNTAIGISIAAFSALIFTLAVPTSAPVEAQSALSDTTYDATASEMITVSSSAVGITAGVQIVSTVNNDRCYVTTETQSLRWTISGTTPTAAVGHLAAAGTEIVLNGRPDIASFRMIRVGGADATAAVTCSRRARR